MKPPKPFFYLKKKKKKECLKSITQHKTHNNSLSFGARHLLNSLYIARLVFRANGMCPLLKNVISKLAKICHLHINRSRYLQSQKREGIWSCWLSTQRQILIHKAGPLTGSSIFLYLEMDFWNQFSTSNENNIWKQCMWNYIISKTAMY